MTGEEIPQGQLFSRVYLRPAELASDSNRMRRRVVALLRATFGNDLHNLASAITEHLGVDVDTGFEGYVWERWTAKCDLRDFLDTLTLAVALQRIQERRWEALVANINRIFDEEAVHYKMDARGGVHYRVDEEFERQLASTIAGLGADRYAAVRAEIERGIEALQNTQPNGKTAIQAMFEAAETLYRFVHSDRPRMTRSSVLQDMRPMVAQKYAGNEAALASAEHMIKSLGEWADACHLYRHGHGKQEPNQPPVDYAVLLVNQGLGFMRWLAGFDSPAK